jgi:flagellar hook assembly protein FlgD
VTLKVFDLSGRLVKTLFNTQSRTIDHESPVTVSWDGSDEKGKEVVSGVYFFRLEAGSLKQTQKAILLR